MTSARAVHLVSATELRDRPPVGLVLLDVRVDAGSGPDRDAYNRGHLPGAHFADLDADLAGPAGEGGLRPLPDLARLSEALRGWGIHGSSPIVVYDGTRSAAAARAWWVLRWAGCTDVRLLDGGLPAWVRAGGDVVTDVPAPGSGTATVRSGSARSVSVEQIPRIVRDGVLLDARPAPLGGHIGGAVSAPVFDDFDGDGLLRDELWLRRRYRDLGVLPGTDTATYCGTAVAAALQVFVLATIGVDAALYVGSFSDWIADPARPVAH